jgi:hypothetical protein
MPGKKKWPQFILFWTKFCPPPLPKKIKYMFFWFFVLTTLDIRYICISQISAYIDQNAWYRPTIRKKDIGICIGIGDWSCKYNGICIPKNIGWENSAIVTRFTILCWKMINRCSENIEKEREGGPLSGSAHARPSAQPPIVTRRNFLIEALASFQKVCPINFLAKSGNSEHFSVFIFFSKKILIVVIFLPGIYKNSRQYVCLSFP